MRKRKWLMSAGLAVAGYLYAAGAQAAYLYWSTVAVKTSYTNICMSFANSTLHGLGYRNIRVSTTEVAGSTKGV